MSFFLLVVFAKGTRGGVVGLEELFLIHKCLSAQQENACVSKTLLPERYVSWPPNKDRPVKLKKLLSRHTHPQTAPPHSSGYRSCPAEV